MVATFSESSCPWCIHSLRGCAKQMHTCDRPEESAPCIMSAVHPVARCSEEYYLSNRVQTEEISERRAQIHCRIPILSFRKMECGSASSDRDQ